MGVSMRMTTVVEPADSPCVWLSLTTTYKPPGWLDLFNLSMTLVFREDKRAVSALVGAVLRKVKEKASRFSAGMNPT